MTGPGGRMRAGSPGAIALRRRRLQPTTARRRRGTIVAGVDHSAEARGALTAGAELAERLDARLVLVTVRPSPAALPPGMATHAEAVREQALEGGRRLLAEHGAELAGRAGARHLLDSVQARVEFGDPATRLAAVGRELEASLIVVGASGRGAVEAALLGSVSRRLAADPPRPLLVVPRGARLRPEPRGVGARRPSIVCGVDGSRSAAHAARVSAVLASGLGNRLVLVHVEQRGAHLPTGAFGFAVRLDADIRRRLRLLHRVADAVPEADVAVSLAAGSPVEALEEAATREMAELIAVGTRGRGTFKALTLGSVSRALCASSPRPVLVVGERTSGVPAAQDRRAR